MAKKNILVFAHWKEISKPKLMGVLYADILRGKEIFSFEYTEEWLKSENAQLLDPELQLYAGPQYLNDTGKVNFGIFLDSSPDRWGRILMRRREAAIARSQERKPKKLFESDFLLRVDDGQRIGGLRVKLEKGGNFLNDNKELACPPWTSIRTLEEISLRLEEEDVIDNPDYLKWLNLLVVPGSSLGGARPKAGVSDAKGNLWIAKFPSRNDDNDIGGWEMVVNELAKDAGVQISEAKAIRFSGNYHTYLTKRFDRTYNGKRVHFASAMTLLGYVDGQDYQDGASYLELAGFIIRYGAKVNEDLHELWRRIVFNICVKNTDDHLRNHGFLLTPKGWILSPAYDINPVETGNGLKLNITEDDNSLDIDLAMEVIDYYRINRKTAEKTIKEVSKAIEKWRDVANFYGIPRADQELKQNAFSEIL